MATKVDVDRDKKAKQAKLNDEAIAKLRKHLSKDQWEQEAVDTFEFATNRNENVLMIPGLKRAAEKFHEKARKHKEKAEQEQTRKRAATYAEKGKGQWNICKDLAGNYAAPLVAVKRPKMGKKGQAAGTIATSLKEVDGIIRYTLGEVYDGNAGDPERTARNYVEN